MNYKAVIFDLDGTLLDTIDDLADSMNAVLKRSSLPVHDTERYRYFVGTGLRNLVRKALPEELRTDDNISKYTNAMAREYEARWDKKTRPYEGIIDLLYSLSEIGVRMAVLSNKPHLFTLKVVEKFLPADFFECVFGDREGIPRKPDPVSALEISSLMKIPPEHFLYVGDSDTDIKTAVSAGMYPVGVKWGFRDINELIRAGAKMILEKPRELLLFFNK
ncbi:MAG: HAD family hydrolase [Clostridiaceae bacterium]|jgi:phosphoglycolate phosphatase|nr:HAD family hydrolase [Clostridiaceae bacterium]